jgi:hypothetical protein
MRSSHPLPLPDKVAGMIVSMYVFLHAADMHTGIQIQKYFGCKNVEDPPPVPPQNRTEPPGLQSPL